MNATAATPLESFHRFVSEQLRSGAAGEISPEQALRLWREKEETLAAVREGLADIEAGRTWPADEVLRELRQSLPET
jgi:predicted transcriptional regulator